MVNERYEIVSVVQINDTVWAITVKKLGLSGEK
jgi:hypothetical protein